MRRITITAICAMALTAPTATAATIPSQTFTVINQNGTAPALVARTERAVTRETYRLHRAWGSPIARFGPGGWPIYLQAQPVDIGDEFGYHDVEGSAPAVHIQPLEPYALPLVFSHEVMETLVDPWANRYIGGKLVEVCDPVESAMVKVSGVYVADFASRATFTRARRGPFDFANAFTSAPDVP